MAITTRVDKLISTVLDAFVVQFPMFTNIARQFSSDGKKFGDTLYARVTKRATVQDYDATNGYEANTVESTALVEDLPVTLNRHKHVPIKVDYMDQNSSDIDLMRAVGPQVFELGEEAMLYLCGLMRGSNFSQRSVYAEADSDLDALINIQGDLNTIGASQLGRFGLVNTAVANAIAADTRITSKDYYDEQDGVAMPYRVVRGVSGFQNIWEYPSLPTGNTSNIAVTGATSDLLTAASAHGLEVGDRVVFTTSDTLPAGLSTATDYYVLTVPSTTTFTVSASDGGSVVDITDTGTGTHGFTIVNALTGFFGTTDALAMVAAIPEKLRNPSPQARKISDIIVQQDSNTGLALAAMHWVKQGTLDDYVSFAWMYGAKAGRQAGTAGDICDYAGHQLVTT